VPSRPPRRGARLAGLVTPVAPAKTLPWARGSPPNLRAARPFS